MLLLSFFIAIRLYFSLGEVGVVYQDTLIKLQSWEEGGYTVNDKIGPRGEIILSGGGVSQGYYKCESESDNASFYTDNQGRKWKPIVRPDNCGGGAGVNI